MEAGGRLGCPCFHYALSFPPSSAPRLHIHAEAMARFLGPGSVGAAHGAGNILFSAVSNFKINFFARERKREEVGGIRTRSGSQENVVGLFGFGVLGERGVLVWFGFILFSEIMV